MDGSKYEGYYIEGNKSGQGSYQWANGSKFVGSWLDNKINGQGSYSWLDGRVWLRYKFI